MSLWFLCELLNSSLQYGSGDVSLSVAAVFNLPLPLFPLDPYACRWHPPCFC